MTHRILVLAVLVVASAACSSPIPGQHAAATIPRCAELEARALVSPNAPVAGALVCLTPEIAQASGLTSDADIQHIAAQPPVFTSYRYLGHTTNGYYFEFSANGSVAGCFRFHIDSTAHVDKVAYKTGGCPHPLP